MKRHVDDVEDKLNVMGEEGSLLVKRTCTPSLLKAMLVRRREKPTISSQGNISLKGGYNVM